VFVLSSIAKKLFDVFPTSFHITIPSGKMRGIKWIAKSANPGQLFGKYEPDQEKVLVDLLKHSTVFWDVGAHVGWYSLLASKYLKHGQIYSFEPNPDNIQYIKQHIRINEINNINLLAYALSSSVGQQHFNPNKQQGSLSDDGTLIVKTLTADQFITDNPNIPDLIKPDLLKVDIEGAELEFLEGAKKLLCEDKPTLLLSAHGYQKRDSCIEFLEKLDYKIKHIVSNQQDGDYVFLATAIPK